MRNVLNPLAAASPRLTRHREAVLDVLRQSHDHPTAADVLERVRAVNPGVGAATVYRALALLVDAGLAQELSVSDGAARYDGNATRHDHVVCRSCGRAVDVLSPLPPAAVSTLARRTGFTLTGYDLTFHGDCPDCTAAATPQLPTHR